MRKNPIGVSAESVRFSWSVPGSAARQTAYRIIVAESPVHLQQTDKALWDSGKVDCAESTHILYEGPPLGPQTYYWWNVRIWDENGAESGCSEPSRFATGISGSWLAEWIWCGPVEPNSHVYFRKEIELEAKPVKSILASVSADDMYKLYVNGQFAGLGPCPSYPDKEQNYNGFELLGLWEPGQPLCIAAHVYYQGLVNYALVSGDGLAGFIAQIRILYEDGTVQIVGTDRSWKAKRSEAYSFTHKFGYETGFNEQIDLRAVPEGWCRPGYSDEGWSQAETVSPGKWKLYAQETETLQVYEQEPVQIEPIPGGIRFDMGKEVAGMLRVTLEGRSGSQLEIRLGEELDDHGAVRYKMRCNCLYQDVWTLRDGLQTAEFYDYRAFRHGELLFSSDSVRIVSVRAVVRHYPFDEDAAHFHSSDRDLNALWDISKYSTKMGTQELYMDCPSREKANYSLDTYLEMSAAYYVAGEWNLSRKMIDYCLQSADDGKLCCLAPAGRPHYFTEYTMYPVLMAKRYYEYTGDQAFLAGKYESLRKVHRYMSGFKGRTGLLEGTNEVLRDLVDWPVNMRDGHEMLPVNIVPNSVFYAMTKAMAEIAEAVGKREDAAEFIRQAEQLGETINARLWNPETNLYIDGMDLNGVCSSHSSLHSNVFPLAMGLVPKEKVEPAMRHIRSRGLRCNLFLAMFLFEALFDYDAADYAFELLKADGEYSPLNMIRKGATTTWEAWDLSHKANASLCHPAGAFTAYLIGSRVMGVMPAEPGFARVRIRPQPGSLQSASIRVPTIRGPVDVRFDRTQEAKFVLECRIPANTKADIYVPNGGALASGEKTAVLVNGVPVQGEAADGWLPLCGLPSGHYRIEAAGF
jgi:hypothetical protein